MVQTGLGAWGERVAVDHLREAGFEILSRNWRAPEGELDIIAREEGTIVFVEVKARASGSYGPPEAAVTARKQRRLQRTAWRYLEASDLVEVDWRIDVIAIERSADGTLGRLDHYVNAIGEAPDLRHR